MAIFRTAPGSEYILNLVRSPVYNLLGVGQTQYKMLAIRPYVANDQFISIEVAVPSCS